jgi:hypothetical protein
MKTSIEILEMAFQSLRQTSKEDVKSRTKQLGIEIPQEPKLSCLVNHFIFDLGGAFNEIINSKKTEWVDFESLKRKGLVRIFYENISFGEDMGEKVVVEKI